MPAPSGEQTIGARIAYYRRSLGLTQNGLALRLHRSPSWVTKVERGERQLDSVRTLLQVARALGVEVRDLTGQPWFPEPGGPGHEAVPAIRKALIATRPRATQDGQAPPRDLAALRRDVLAAGRLWQAERHCYSIVVPLLPGLLAQARAAADPDQAPAGSRRQANRVLAEVSHLAQEVLARLGEPDLGWVAARQGMAAAELAGAPALEAASAWRVCHAVLRLDDLDEVDDLAGVAAARLLAPLRDPGPEAPELLSAYGGLRLVGAVAAARALDHTTAWSLLDDGRRAADRLGGDRNDFWMTFGPTNVAIHQAALALELGDPAAALRFAEGLDVSHLPSLERRSTHHVQLAHAYSLRRRPQEAVAALLEAERLNPEGLRYHMLARELVASLVRRERRRTTASPGLRGLARRLYVVPG